MTIPGKIQSYLAAGIPIIGMLNGEAANLLIEASRLFLSTMTPESCNWSK